MGTALEVAKMLVSPAKKLFEVAKIAVGTSCTDLEVDKIHRVSAAIRTNADIPIVYSKDGITIDASNHPPELIETAERASHRVAYQEIKKQQNIESVMYKAYQEVKDDEDVPDEPIEQDWILRLFKSIEDVSDEQMQELWAKILAGEVRQPGSFSLRTLHTLSNMSKKEAETFQRVAQFSILNKPHNFIYNNVGLIREYDFERDIFILYDCGLMAETFGSSVGYKGGNIYTASMVFVCNNDEYTKVNFPVFRFNPVGCELLKVFSFEQNQEYFLKVFKSIKEKFPQLKLTGHLIKGISEDGETIYDKNDILI